MTLNVDLTLSFFWLLQVYMPTSFDKTFGQQEVNKHVVHYSFWDTSGNNLNLAFSEWNHVSIKWNSGYQEGSRWSWIYEEYLTRLSGLPFYCCYHIIKSWSCIFSDKAFSLPITKSYLGNFLRSDILAAMKRNFKYSQRPNYNIDRGKQDFTVIRIFHFLFVLLQ